jgi:hypothetical protein
MKKFVLALAFLFVVSNAHAFSTSVELGVTLTGFPPPDPAVVQALEKAKSVNSNETWEINLRHSNINATVSVEFHGNSKIVTINYY